MDIRVGGRILVYFSHSALNEPFQILFGGLPINILSTMQEELSFIAKNVCQERVILVSKERSFAILFTVLLTMTSLHFWADIGFG